jgi:hypothetical protein
MRLEIERSVKKVMGALCIGDGTPGAIVHIYITDSPSPAYAQPYHGLPHSIIS